MWYAFAPSNGPIRGDYGFAYVLGVGTTLSACGAPPVGQGGVMKQEASPVRVG